MQRTEYIEFIKNIEDFIQHINKKLSDHVMKENDHDDIIDSIIIECQEVFSLTFDLRDLYGNHYKYEEEDPFFYGSVPRCHLIFPRNKSRNLIACVTTVTSGFDHNTGGYVGYVPTHGNIPFFFLESIIDENGTQIYSIHPAENKINNFWYERK
ncbi:hypothetical protein BST79_gp145 [Only Syngen Nebraska virus 5]|uniref:hypothetical protein n=1 Tax=Only Syngen Nebraska virus 5 TaxID=1917232 RepID=UPI0009013C30|nr:hypothetical protein BST79_gp145 [Only Syngen Nebraska virus 5]APC25658.1 hypothetical protein [Only Syngen Nebraska virus 5]